VSWFNDPKILAKIAFAVYGDICSADTSDAAEETLQQYGFSDVRLGKVCKALWVPVPGRGYWAKKDAGRPTRKRPPLPLLPNKQSNG
jgi:hypothetical protein